MSVAGTRKSRRSAGVCVDCNARARAGKAQCAKCAERAAASQARNYRNRKAAGLCKECGEPSRKGKVRCAKCAKALAEYQAAHRGWGTFIDNRTKASRHSESGRLKLRVLNAYGGQKCACCGETLFEGLTIDHILGGGGKHARRINGGLYPWIVRNNFPPGFQVLCGTCNLAKGTSDHCPHEDARIAWG